MNNKNIVAP